ncbi:hypothetical protein PHMEG_00032268 [Phytophthora megakarya]|uniref:Uncharacterized protein n=1 Tax=Phytophthora megakarya TaxID=4795 RepID=A0A225UXI9_9STRA|nr:hypothetical protein PHMEG_00032268 [Phytophthora megakarya]
MDYLCLNQKTITISTILNFPESVRTFAIDKDFVEWRKIAEAFPDTAAIGFCVRLVPASVCSGAERPALILALVSRLLFPPICGGDRKQLSGTGYSKLVSYIASRHENFRSQYDARHHGLKRPSKLLALFLRNIPSLPLVAMGCSEKQAA